MITLELPRDAVDDGYNHRPENLYDEVAGFSYDTFRKRRYRMDTLRVANSGIIYAGIYANEIDFTQFFFKDPITGGSLQAWFFQIPMFLEYDFLGFCGRDIGKSFILQLKMLHRAITYPNGSALLATFDEGHTEKLITKNFDWLDSHPVLSQFKDTGPGARKRRIPGYQRYTNGYEWNAVAAGEQSHRSLEAPHVMSFFGDEFQHFPKMGWSKVSPAINDQVPYRKYGTCRFIVGVNTECRTDSAFIDLAFGKNSPFKGHVYQFASWCNPISYTLEKHKEYLHDFGGSINTNEFKQTIRGLTGQQARSVIPEDLFNDAVAYGKLLGLETRICRISKQTWENKNQNLYDILGTRFLDFPATECILSADYGYSAPTEIGVWFHMSCDALSKRVEHTEPKWALWGRISLVKIEPAIQAHIVDALNELYSPMLISMDSTASTNPVTTVLTDPYNKLYNSPDKDYKHKVFEAKFNGDITIRYEEEKPDNAGREYKLVTVNGINMYALRAPANEFSTNYIVQLLYDRRLALPDDESVRRDFMGMVEVKTGKQTTYKGTPQHIVSMVRAFAQVHHVVFVLRELEVRMLEGYNDGDQGGVYGSSIALSAPVW